jgi:carbon-monoxide dehydrogenase medium subunit
MGVAAFIVLDEDRRCRQARLVYLNAGDGPLEAKEAVQMLEGEAINDERIESAAALASEKEINPFGNVHASPDFQRHLARVLTCKTLKLATQRAAQDSLQ